jgi:predicted nuclease with TOPRIM domain
MREQLHNRLEELKSEFETGQVKLRELEMQQLHLRERLLRISGAIQVLEEVLAESKPREENDAATRGTQRVPSRASGK